MPKFEVPIVYRGLANFIVTADTTEAAEEIACNKFRNGQQEDRLGNESEEIDRVLPITQIDHDDNVPTVK